jgi:hypothetical protein
MLRHNCCDFSSALCNELGVGSIPTVRAHRGGGATFAFPIILFLPWRVHMGAH